MGNDRLSGNWFDYAVASLDPACLHRYKSVLRTSMVKEIAAISLFLKLIGLSCVLALSSVWRNSCEIIYKYYSHETGAT